MKNLLTILSVIWVVAVAHAQPPAVREEGTPPVPSDVGVVPVSEIAEPKDTTPDSLKVYQFVEVQPEFPGGQAEMMRFIAKNIIYPDMAIDCNCSSKVYVQFVVETDGSVANAKILRGANCGGSLSTNKKGKLTYNESDVIPPDDTPCSTAAIAMDNEALRVINKMPKWNPGKQSGKLVRTFFNLPIAYQLQ